MMDREYGIYKKDAGEFLKIVTRFIVLSRKKMS